VREEIPIGAETWLRGGPVVVPMPAKVLATFRPGAAKVVTFVGPHRLYRAADWDATRGGAQRRCSRGGEEQACFKSTPTLNTVNPLWVYGPVSVW
jgi:hypothetical protein